MKVLNICLLQTFLLGSSKSHAFSAAATTTAVHTFNTAPPGEADESFNRAKQLEKNGYARAAAQSFHEAATMYQCYIDHKSDANSNLSDSFAASNAFLQNKLFGISSDMNYSPFDYVTNEITLDGVCTMLAYCCIRLAHLNLDALADPKAASRLYKDAASIDLHPSAVSYHGMGNAIEAAEYKLDKAVEAYKQALEIILRRQDNQISNDNYRLMFDLAVALERLGRLEESEVLFERLRRGGPTSNSLVDSWGYVRWHMRKSMDTLNLHRGTRSMIQLGLDAARPLIDTPNNGLVCEFGVASGRSIRLMQEMLPLDVAIHGFDTFTGLPEAWGDEPAGTYSVGGNIPQVDGKVFFHKGLFTETIPGFLAENKDKPLAFANIDCDLYSSTYDILEAFQARVVPGTIFAFDEYICHPTWREDEFRAWRECCKRFGWTYEYLGFSMSSKQAVVQVTGTGVN